MCRGRESNPHRPVGRADFKSIPEADRLSPSVADGSAPSHESPHQERPPAPSAGETDGDDVGPIVTGE
jgi:hypothetical protein